MQVGQHNTASSAKSLNLSFSTLVVSQFFQLSITITKHLIEHSPKKFDHDDLNDAAVNIVTHSSKIIISYNQNENQKHVFKQGGQHGGNLVLC